jgi:RNase adaptor protein for sRNA GlmZ degradation
MEKNNKRENKIIKLIYDRYENEFGVSYFQNNDIIIDKTTILDNLPMKINDIDINFDRILTIYSWGIKKDKKSVDCDIIFDLTKFQTKIDKDLDVHTITGLTDIIQDSVIRHPKFLELIETIVDNIETMNPKSVGFICNHGKHRSVAWAELIHKLYYKKSIIKHLCRKNWIM